MIPVFARFKNEIFIILIGSSASVANQIGNFFVFEEFCDEARRRRFSVRSGNSDFGVFKEIPQKLMIIIKWEPFSQNLCNLLIIFPITGARDVCFAGLDVFLIKRKNFDISIL